MKKLLKIAFYSFAVASLLNGCASSLMSPAEQTEISSDKAVITFYRTASFGGAIQAPIARESAAGFEFVGVSSKDTRIEDVVTPGKYTYVVGGESSNMMTAEVEAGKSYYAIVEPAMGWLKARFHLLVQRGEDWLKASRKASTLQLVKINEEGRSWWTKNQNSMASKLYNAKEDFNQEDTRKVMKPADGQTITDDESLHTSASTAQ